MAATKRCAHRCSWAKAPLIRLKFSADLIQTIRSSFPIPAPGTPTNEFDLTKPTMTSSSPNPQTSSRKNGSTPLIQLNAVTKVFLTDEVETHALSGIHLDIRDGEYVSIAGPSGCGKSTLLSILGLLDTPSNGRYALKSNEVANLSFADRARIRNSEIG